MSLEADMNLTLSLCLHKKEAFLMEWSPLMKQPISISHSTHHLYAKATAGWAVKSEMEKKKKFSVCDGETGGDLMTAYFLFSHLYTTVVH